MINFRRLQEVAYALMPKYRGAMRCFHVAGIYKNSKLIALGFNKDTTHPKVKRYNYYDIAGLHAELSACIRGGRSDYRGHSMAVLRIDKNGRLNQSCPCAGCKSVLIDHNFRKVYHTTEIGTWDELNLDNLSLTKKSPQRF